MDISLFGTKELYWAAIKATSEIEVNGRVVQPNETIAEFDNIQISVLKEIKDIKIANGGYGNESHVFWDSTVEIDFNFSQGIFSKTHLALLSNSDIYPREKELIWIPETENLETNENGRASLKHSPLSKAPLFIYDRLTGEKVNEYFLQDKEIILGTPYKNIIVSYYFTHISNSTIIRVGTRLVKDFVRLEGKTRLKDDKTGSNVTGLIVIPKMKMMSDLSVRLGEDASPTVVNFAAIGYPTGERGRKTVCEMAILDKDIDRVF